MPERAMKTIMKWCLAGLVLAWAMPGWAAEDFSKVPVKGMVTMLDLGAKKCIPCKMMAPIMVAMEKKYAGRAAVVFIDVWEHQDQVGRFGIRAIPTQIFYDTAGREVYRHVGFLGEKQIVQIMTRLGVQP